MQLHRRYLLFLVFLFMSEVAALAQQPALRGFTSAHSVAHRDLEQRFMTLFDPARAEKVHKTLTREPHIAGSSGDRRTAEYVLQQFRSYGLDAEIEVLKAVLSEPREVKFDLLEPLKFSGPGPEYVAEDPASKDTRTSIGFNAYSGSGDVVGDVVYANYGLPVDYELLRTKGISVEAKIVIVRYGACYRGVKAKVAEENKARGLIIYSDPQDDAYHAGDTYPNGPWRPSSGVQRGSVLYEFIYPGSVAPDGSNTPHLPVMPLSYKDAQHILRNLSGAAAPPEWQGGLPFTYHFGPGRSKVRMRVHMEQVVRPIWNVIAKIPGTQSPEEIVLLGNHRDAWVYGAVDPNSGTTSMLEMAHGLGTLLRGGWRPRRSIWLCSWDGEEFGEFGSVPWADKHAKELNAAAIAYLNVDSSVSGNRFSASAAPSLKRLVLEAAADVPDAAGGSILDEANQRLRGDLRRELLPGHSSRPGAEPKPISQQEFEIGNLGGGTDFIAFFDHLGYPSVDFDFEGSNGVYHSIFDNHRWMKKFGDPHFRINISAARLLGFMALRLAEADLLPLDYETYGRELELELEGSRNKLALLGQSNQLDFQPAQHAAQELTRVARQLAERCEAQLLQGTPPPNLYELNRTLVSVEQAFLLRDGLPGRPWYKHALFAPGAYDGYASVALPGLQESADAEKFEEANRQLDEITKAINRASNLLAGLSSENER